MARAAESPCDVSLPQVESNPYGYRLRGDRCEGVYAREVGASLTLASLTESFQDYDAGSGRPLVVEWSKAPGDAGVHLRAVALRRRLYYRMDTVRPAETTSYEWSPGLLAALGIARVDLGVLGFARARVGATERSVYVPLRIAQQSKPARARGYLSSSCPASSWPRCSSAWPRSVPMAVRGPSSGTASRWATGSYPAERAVEIPISGLPAPGIYYLEVGAKRRTGETLSLEVWLYHAGGG